MNKNVWMTILFLLSPEAQAQPFSENTLWSSALTPILWLAPILIGCALVIFAITYLDKKSKPDGASHRK